MLGVHKVGNIMKKVPLIFALVSFLLAALIFTSAEGSRALYSGLFFVVIGVVLLVNARRKARGV